MLSPSFQLKLRTIDMGNNRIGIIENLSHLTNLEELWVSPGKSNNCSIIDEGGGIQLNDNLVPNLNDVPSQLSQLTSLQTIYLEGNPCQKNDMVHYRRKLILALPQLSQIDAT